MQPNLNNFNIRKITKNLRLNFFKLSKFKEQNIEAMKHTDKNNKNINILDKRILKLKLQALSFII